MILTITNRFKALKPLDYLKYGDQNTKESKDEEVNMLFNFGITTSSSLSTRLVI